MTGPDIHPEPSFVLYDPPLPGAVAVPASQLPTVLEQLDAGTFERPSAVATPAE